MLVVLGQEAVRSGLHYGVLPPMQVSIRPWLTASAEFRSLLSRSKRPSPLSPVLCRASLGSTLQRGVSADISRIIKSAPQQEGTDAASQVHFCSLAGGRCCFLRCWGLMLPPVTGTCVPLCPQ